jgi:hypothetical protein
MGLAISGGGELEWGEEENLRIILLDFIQFGTFIAL